MNKSELVKIVAKNAMMPHTEALVAVNSTLECITKALARGEEVVINHFGTFQIKEMKEREGRNPATGEVILIEAKKRPAFKPFKYLKEAVNQ